MGYLDVGFLVIFSIFVRSSFVIALLHNHLPDPDTYKSLSRPLQHRVESLHPYLSLEVQRICISQVPASIWQLPPQTLSKFVKMLAALCTRLPKVVLSMLTSWFVGQLELLSIHLSHTCMVFCLTRLSIGGLNVPSPTQKMHANLPGIHLLLLCLLNTINRLSMVDRWCGGNLWLQNARKFEKSASIYQSLLEHKVFSSERPFQITALCSMHFAI